MPSDFNSVCKEYCIDWAIGRRSSCVLEERRHGDTFTRVRCTRIEIDASSVEERSDVRKSGRDHGVADDDIQSRVTIDVRECRCRPGSVFDFDLVVPMIVNTSLSPFVTIECP